jgi:hypothetical protein
MEHHLTRLARSQTGGKFAMNGVSFVPPTTPVLLQILSGAEDAQSLLPTGSVFPLPKNSLIQVSIPGGGQVRGVLMARRRRSELRFFFFLPLRYSTHSTCTATHSTSCAVRAARSITTLILSVVLSVITV